MSLQFSGAPQSFTPVFNPIYFYVDSTNRNMEGFKYIVDIFSASTTTKIARYKLFPRPIDGIGVADVNQILATQVGFSFNPTVNNWITNNESYVKYDIKVGEEFVNTWNYDLISGNIGEQTTSLINTGFTSASAATYIVGDQILIEGSPIDDYNGVHNVTYSSDFFGVWLVKIDVPYNNISGTSVYDTGSTMYSDHRKTQWTGLTSSTNNVAFNGSIRHEDFLNYTASTYNIGINGTSFVSSVPNYYKMKIGNHMWLNYKAATNAYLNANYLVINTDDGGSFRYLNPSASTTTEKMMQIAIGPDNLNNFEVTPTIVSGSIPPIKSTTTRYSAHTETSSSGKSSATYIFDIDDSCSGKYVNTQFIFLDRMGSFCPANFELKSVYKINITRDEYQKTLGYLDKVAGNWTYNPKDRGRTNLSTIIKKSADFTSNWMSETNATFLEEFFSSPEVYIYEDGNYWPVIIKDSDYVFKTKLNEKLINYTCTIEYSCSDRVQNF